MKHITKLIASMAVALAGSALVAPAANAADPSSNDPQVSLTGIQYSTASFDVNANEAANASLTASTGAKVVLNVHVKPLKKRQIRGRCWHVKPGTVIWNQVVDPATGRLAVIRWTVPAGDNTFCHKKGAGRQVFKKSCGNKVWGVPRGPRRPPAKLHRIRVRTAVQDYLIWSGALTVQTSQSGSAMAYAVQYYNGTKVCEASASVNGAVSVGLAAYVSVQARTRSSISVTAANSAKVSVKNKVNASGELKASVYTQMSGQAKAWCNYVPPSQPQPTMSLVLDRPNDIDQSVANPGGSTDWSFTQTMGHAAAPTGAGDVTYTVRAKYGFVKFVTANSPCQTTGLHDNVVTTITQPSGTYDLTLCYIASTEDPATYGGSDPITLTAVFAGQTYTDTQSIKVNPTPQPPL